MHDDLDDLYHRLVLHDLSNLLTAAHFAIEACKAGDPGALAVVDLSVQRATALLERAMDRTDRVPADARCIERSVRIARHLEPRARLTVGPLDDVGRLAVGSVELERALVNVLRNALTAVGPNGVVELHAIVGTARVDLLVVDDGPGMGAPSVRQGRGLGLRSTRQALERCGGMLLVESSPDGTRITLRIPTS